MGWIWENAQWPHFKWNSDQIMPLVGDIRQKIGELCGMLKGLGMQVELETALSAMSDELVHSCGIEGVVLNPAMVRSSVAMRLGLPDEGLPASSHYIDGLVDVMIDACHLSSQPLTHERLFQWHRMLFPTTAGEDGKYRSSQPSMQVISGVIGREVVHFEAPPSNRVYEMMDEYIEWMNHENSLDFMIKSAIGALWFVTVHPFSDGNGRLSRILTDMILAKGDQMAHRYYSMTMAIEKKSAEYYQILEQTQRGDMDITRWLSWFLMCLKSALDTTESEITEAIHRTHFWEYHSNVPLNERQRYVMAKFMDHFEGKLTTSKYAKLAKCSEDTALRDLQHLVLHHVLKVEGIGRGTHYVLQVIE